MESKSKDPAFLFYSSDFITGIQDLTMEERGQYITLLCISHQKGRLSDKMMSLSVGKVSEDVLAKFKKDDDGFYFNQRLEKESAKRKIHTEKQKERALNGWKKRKEDELRQSSGTLSGEAAADATALPLENENENENRNINKDETGKEGMGEKPKPKKPPLPYAEIIQIFNSVCTDLPEVTEISDGRKKIIKARVEEYSIEKLGDVFRKTHESDFLSGRKKEWKATFDWILIKANFIKILEDNYINHEQQQTSNKPKLQYSDDLKRKIADRLQSPKLS